MSETERLREALDDLLPYAIHAQAATWKVGNDWSMKFSIAIERARAALAATPTAERGEWQAVPVEPTREMWAAAGDAVVDLQRRNIGHHDCFSEAVWDAMLKAAPSSPPAETMDAQEGER